MTEAVRLDFPTWTPIAARGREPVSFGAWNTMRDNYEAIEFAEQIGLAISIGHLTLELDSDDQT